jgi:uncharacterized membrane protein YdbT with pleckstrin-like domain
LLTAVCLLVAFPWGGLAIILLLPLFLLRAWVESRFISYARLPCGIVFRSGAWHRKTSATLSRNIQVITVEASPFDRRYQMASLTVDTAGAGVAKHRIRIPYLPGGVAEQLARELSREAELAGFHWSLTKPPPIAGPAQESRAS